MNGTSPHLTLEELAAHGSTGPLPAAAGRHLAECGACRARSRAVAADGVRFLVTRCQLPPSLIDHVLADIDARAPAGTTRRVARRRRRPLALRWAAGVAAALTAGAVALAVVGVPGARHGGTRGPVVDAAYVVQRVDSALSAAGPGEIGQMMVTIRGALPPGGATIAEEWSFRGRWRAVTSSPAGHPVYDEGSSTSSVYTVVSYPTRTWARQHGLRRPAARLPLVPGSHGCEPLAVAGPKLIPPGLAGIGFPTSPLPATVAQVLRTAVSCGTLAVAGRQRVDGIEAIELTSRRTSPFSETVWVSPGTYLPLRVVVRSAPGMPALRQTADITWLRPTAQNLARLTVRIPAGFRQVPLARILQQILGGPLKKSR